MFGQAGDIMQMAQNPAQSERIRALASAFAAVERDQREAVRAHAEALGADPDELGIPEPPEQEQRVTQLCEVVGARFSGNFWDTWCEHVAPDALDAEAAEEFATMGPDEWEDEQESIVEDWRADPEVETEGFTDGQLVAADVRSRFNVEPETFEEFVIGFAPGRLFNRLLAGEFSDNTEAIEQLTEKVQADG